MKHLYLIVLLFIFAYANRAFCQRSNEVGKTKRPYFILEGKVIDKSTGEPLPFANITIMGTNVGTSSNVDGHFTFLNVPSDTCTLLISNIGYQTLSLRLTPETKLDNLVLQL